MARIPRVTTPGVLHHVISRFVDREWFFVSDEERNTYLTFLGRALAKTDWRCLSYCLMSNHLHFAMVAGALDLDSWARKVNSPFANWLNKERGRLGPVFADRPKANKVPLDREAHVIAYIHNNPVRADLVETAGDSPWSSHQAYLGRARPPRWLHVGEGLARAGCAGDPQAFDGLVHGLAGSTLELPDVARARGEAHRLGPFEIGTPTLSEPVEFPILGRPFVRARPSLPILLETVAARLGVTASATARRHARGTVAVAKRVAIHAAVSLGITISDVSAAVNVSRQRGSKVAQTRLSSEEQKIVDEVVDWLGKVDKVDTVPDSSCNASRASATWRSSGSC
jgi:REP element-mobilizing transposase RayT